MRTQPAKALLRLAALLAGVMAGIPASASGQEDVPEQAALHHQFDQDIHPLLETYCIGCHNQDRESGDIRLDLLGAAITAQNIAVWTDAKNMLDVGSMPPKKTIKRPTRAEQERILDWIGGSLRRYDADHQETGGDTLLRRINNRAYANMIRTLLGTPAQLMDRFPMDAATDGFDTVGAGLYTTAYLYDCYLSSVQRTLDLAISTSPAAPKTTNIGYHYAKGAAVGDWQQHVDALRLALKELAADPLRFAHTNADYAGGDFIVRFEIWGVVGGHYHTDFNTVQRKKIDWQHDPACVTAITGALERKIASITKTEIGTMADGQPIGSISGGANDPIEMAMDVRAQEPGFYDISTRLCLSDPRWPLPMNISVDGHFVDQFMVYALQGAPQACSVRVYLTAGVHRLTLTPFQDFQLFVDYVNSTYGTRYTRGDYHNANYNYVNVPLAAANVLYCDFIAKGPINQAWPRPETARIFTRGLSAPPTREYAEEILSSFISRAYACDCDAQTAQPFVDLLMADFAAGKDFVRSVKVALSAVLTSPRFLNLDEQQRSDTSRRRPLTGFELARRLAYFLWSDLPDDALLASARSGALTGPGELLAQTRRMLADPRSSAFREAFSTQWLKIDTLEAVPVDPQRFPTVDPVLISLAKQESVAFFSELLDHNLSVANFIDSDFAMLNGRLASHYGIPGITGNELRHVVLPPGAHRGGVLGQASVLIANGNGMITSPVRRGAFIMQRLLGVFPGVPPPNVPALARVDTVNAAGLPLTPRERLAMHRSIVSCARCHDKIDPLGVGLENFDAAGAWHAKIALVKGVTKDGRLQWVQRDADVSGTMLDGTPYNGADELKKRLLDHEPQFVRSLAENLTIYALGRGLELSDRPVLDALCARLHSQGDGLGSLVEDIVLSEIFTTK